MAVSAFFERDQILRDGDEVDGADGITGLHKHDSGAHGQVQQELAHGDVKVRLFEHSEHLLVVQIQGTLGLGAALLRDLRARLQAAPLALGREDARLQAVGKALGAVDGRRVKDPAHLLAPAYVALVVARVQIALGQGELVGILVQAAKVLLAVKRQLLTGKNLLWCQSVSHFSSLLRIV